MKKVAFRVADWEQAKYSVGNLTLDGAIFTFFSHIKNNRL